MAIGREQRRAREDANRLATEDPLTGLRNAAVPVRRARAGARPQPADGRGFCLLMIDLDDLKGDQRPASATSSATGRCASSAT